MHFPLYFIESTMYIIVKFISDVMDYIFYNCNPALPSPTYYTKALQVLGKSSFTE